MAVVDYYLKIDGVDGESQDSSFKGQIEIESWTVGSSQSSAGIRSATGGAGTGRVAFQDFTFTMRSNKASPKLFVSCASGDHFKTVTLSVRKAGGGQQVYLTVTMTTCFITSFVTTGGSTGGTGNNVVPIDTITLAYGSINYQYTPQNADGTLGSPVKTGWDVAANKKV